MPLPSARRTHRLCHRVIVALVAASLLSMPVTYRGGAEAAHPHTIFQLWEDARTGSYTHHGAAARAGHHPHAVEHAKANVHVEATDGHTAMAHEATGDAPSMVEPGRQVDEADGRWLAEVSRFPTTLATMASVEADEDAPTVSSAFTPDVRGTALVLTALGAATGARASQPVAEEATRLVGRVPSPVAPPPRTAA